MNRIKPTGNSLETTTGHNNRLVVDSGTSAEFVLGKDTQDSLRFARISFLSNFLSVIRHRKVVTAMPATQ